ncbi:MAG: TetR/AcrR family transcriptional regulator [Spirochaetales bacterium]|nr:TetR/AcrR family transcriptional regulator [Spirochaetales bacterium]
MEKITSRKRQAIETKNKLLDLAIKMIRENGYDNMKLEEICAEAGVSVGAFYHHFKNKAGIIVESYRRVDEHFNNEIIGKLSSRSTFDRIIEYLVYQAEETEYFGIDVIIQIYKAQLSDATEFFLSTDRGLPSNLCRLIEEGQRSGEITDELAAGEIADELLIINRGILYNWSLKRGSYDIGSKSRRILTNYLETYKL